MSIDRTRLRLAASGIAVARDNQTTQDQTTQDQITLESRQGGSMRIGLTSIFVDDQDQAERFYSEVLGLKIKTSAPYHPGDRWLTVVSPEDPDGVELVLHVADDPARVFREASRAIGRPAIWYAPLIQWHALAGAKRATGVLVAPYQTVGPAAEEAGSR